MTITIGYDAALLTSGEQPLLLHGWSKVHRWLPEPAVVNTGSHTLTAKLNSFSPLDIIDDATYYAGIVTGNRTDLPSGCGGAPRWVDGVTLPDSNQDPLPLCFSSSSNEAEAVLNMVNNRGYAQVVTISGATVDVAKSRFADSLEGEIAKLFAGLSSHGGPSTFVLGPGDSATVTIDRPPPQQAAQDVHVDQAPQVVSGAGEMAWAVLSTASDTVSVPVDRVNCIMTAVYNASSSGSGPSSAIDQMHSCIDAAATGTVKDLLQKLAYGLLVDDFFYKIIDLEGDQLYPPQTGFTIPGSNPTFTNPNIHISPLTLGTLPDGQTTTVQLTATGGTAPYRFYIWNDPANAAKVPSWVRLASDGTLTIEPPASASGEVSFAVYAFDANGEHSPFARDEIRFATALSGSGSGGGGGASGHAIAAGNSFSCAVLASRHVDCWGDNGVGELGDGVLTGPETCEGSSGERPCSTTPVTVSALTNVTQLASSTSGGGAEHVCALLAEGQVDCWGDNLFGELGNGTTTGPESCGFYGCSATPVSVHGITNVSEIATGSFESCALLSDGHVDCWGQREGANSTEPVEVSGIANATQIASGNSFSCALLAGGHIDCWGLASYGALGDGTDTGNTCGDSTCSTTPVAVTGITDATQIAAGGANACALLSNGTVNCWGNSGSGQLGTGATTGPEECGFITYCSTSPVAVSGISNATQITTGEQISCALLTTATVNCWGNNTYGELGIGTFTGPEECEFSKEYPGVTAPCGAKPVAVSGITNATEVSAGEFSACALLTGRRIECWGHNDYGQLGDATTENRDAPVAVTVLP